MTTEFVSVRKDMSVAQAIEELRRNAQHAETLDALYVTQHDDELVGFVPLRALLLSEPSVALSDVFHENVISVPPEMDQEEVAQVLAKYDLQALPVVGDGKILGVITSDDILDVLAEEQSEDVQKMGAVEPIDAGYFEASFSTYLRKRAP